MDRNGKKPKATHDDPAHPERSDTKAHIRAYSSHQRPETVRQQQSANLLWLASASARECFCLEALVLEPRPPNPPDVS